MVRMYLTRDVIGRVIYRYENLWPDIVAINCRKERTAKISRAI